MSPEKRIAVVGVGNAFLSDDGIGIHVLERLARVGVPEDVTLVVAETRVLDFMDTFRRVDRVIVVDAVKGGGAPGKIYRLRLEELGPGAHRELSLHHIGIIETFKLMRSLGRAPLDILIIGVEPATVEPGTDLSPELAARLEDATRVVLEELSSRAEE